MIDGQEEKCLSSPFVSWLLAGSWGKAFWEVGAGKEAEWGKAAEGDGDTSVLLSPVKKEKTLQQSI